MRPSRRPTVALAAGLVLVLVACGADAHDEAATVDGRSIAREAVESPVRDALNRAGALEGLDADERADLVEPLQRQVLSLLIQASVIEDIAEERDLEPDADELEARFQQDVEGMGGEDALADTLAQQQLSVSLYRDVLLPTQLRVEVILEQLADDIEPSEAREARHILVETEEEAEDVLRQLAAGEDFGALAEERSIDPGSGAAGGDLGSAPPGAYVGPFDQAVWTSEVGEIVGPVATDFGFHVIEVTGEVTVTADDLSPEERQQRSQQLLNELLEERFAAAEVEVADRFGEWNAQTGEILPGPEVGGNG